MYSKQTFYSLRSLHGRIGAGNVIRLVILEE